MEPIVILFILNMISLTITCLIVAHMQKSIRKTDEMLLSVILLFQRELAARSMLVAALSGDPEVRPGSGMRVN